MSEYSKTIGEIEVKCPRCGYNKSHKKILFDGVSEFGECMNCGKMTYNKPLETTPPTNNTTIKCPTCNSTNVQKLSATKRTAHGLMFGLFSKTARSQFGCKNCGYKW